jgi:hypothetical protein
MSDAELVEKYGGMLLRAEEERDALRAEVQGLLVEHERLTLELIATRARVEKLEAVLKEMHEHER